jgi:hypothetical protein
MIAHSTCVLVAASTVALISRIPTASAILFILDRGTKRVIRRKAS